VRQNGPLPRGIRAETDLLRSFRHRSPMTSSTAIRQRAVLDARGAVLRSSAVSIAPRESDKSEFARIRGRNYQKTSVAEPLNLQARQLIDELNRARAQQPRVATWRRRPLITQSNVPNGAGFDRARGYHKNYLPV
jgi:hypothetical protein